MKRREREALAVVYKALGFPMPASGTQSISIRGLSTYAADARQIIPKARAVLAVLLTGEAYRGALQEDVSELREAVEKGGGG